MQAFTYWFLYKAVDKVKWEPRTELWVEHVHMQQQVTTIT
jgi:hypothetical protein